MIHRLDLVSDFMDGTTYAECSCGWRGPKRELLASATADGERHLREIADEPDSTREESA